MTRVTAIRGMEVYAWGMAVILDSYQNAISFRPEKFNAVMMGASNHMKGVLTCFEPGQFIPVHRPGVDMLLVVLEGEGRVVAGEREQDARPGTVLFVPAGEARGVKAATRMVALHVVSPPPTESDHAEVGARLQQGQWR